MTGSGAAVVAFAAFGVAALIVVALDRGGLIGDKEPTFSQGKLLVGVGFGV